MFKHPKSLAPIGTATSHNSGLQLPLSAHHLIGGEGIRMRLSYPIVSCLSLSLSFSLSLSSLSESLLLSRCLRLGVVAGVLVLSAFRQGERKLVLALFR